MPIIKVRMIPVLNGIMSAAQAAARYDQKQSIKYSDG
jgi:hypothetical protein